MNGYKIEWKKSVENDFKKINNQYIKRILNACNKLSTNPFSTNCKKIKRADSYYRIRISDYRVIYKVNTKGKVIIISYIRHRNDIYKKFKE